MNELAARLNTTLSGRYAVGREVGSGGMAVVFEANDIKHDRTVALKVLRPDVMASVSGARFLQEIRIAAGLRHPNILPLYDSGDADGLLFYVMPLVNGVSLRDKLARDGQLPMDEVLRVAAVVADALTHAHARSVVHRDIKPENVLIEEHHTFITDFGVAKAISEAKEPGGLTTEGLTVGTPAYMSPEQAAADPALDHRTDIYALGLLCYEMACGRPPFEAATPQELLVAHITQIPKPLSAHRPGVSRDFERLVKKCLEKNPDDRWQDTEAVWQRLKEQLHTEEGQSGPGGGFRSRLGAPGRLVLAAVVVLIVVLAVAKVLPGFVADAALETQGRVLIPPLDNRTGENLHDALGALAADLIAGDIDRAGFAQAAALPPDLMSELDGANTSARSAVLQAAAQEVGAEVVVSGSFYARGDSVQFQVQLLDSHGASVLRTIDPVVGLPDGDEVLQSLRQRTIGALAVQLDAPMVAGDLLEGASPTLDAYTEFLEGLRHFYIRQHTDALVHFDSSAALDTAFVAPLFLGAVTHLSLGQWVAVDSLARLLDGSRGRVSPAVGQTVNWLLANATGDRAAALRAAREATEFSPTSSALYRLAVEALKNNRPREALDALEKLDREWTGFRGWSSYWETLTEAHHLLGQHERELEAALAAREQYPELVSVLSYGVRANAALGDTSRVFDLLDQRTTLRGEPGWPQWNLPLSAALELRAHGYVDQADSLIQRALAVNPVQQRGQVGGGMPAHGVGGATLRSGRARLLYLARRWDEARDIADTLLLEDPGNPEFLGLAGVIAARAGERDRANNLASALARLDRRYLFGTHALWRARIAAILGDHDLSMRLLHAAFRQGLTHGIWLHRDVDLEPLREREDFQRLSSPAG